MANEISLDLNFDYQNLKYKVGISYLNGFAIPDSVTSVPYKIIDSNGIIMSVGNAAVDSSILESKYASDSPSFGAEDQYCYALDRGSQSGSLYFTNPYKEFRIDYNLDPGIAALSGLFYFTYIAGSNLTYSQKSNSYSGVPIQLKRGEASLNAKVTAVQGNRITWTNNTLVASHLGVDFSNALVTFLSGAHSGEQVRVISYNNSSKHLFLEKSGNYLNEIIQVAPRLEVIGYSGWSSSEVGARIRFDIDHPIPAGLGSYTGIVTVSGNSTWDILPGLPVVTSTVTIPKDEYFRNPEFGDIIKFKTALGNDATGMIVEAAMVGNNYGLKYYPRQDPGSSSPNNNFTLVRSAKFDVELYPQFGQNYTLVTCQTGTDNWMASQSFQAPVATLELSAGDYDSAFPGVVDTSHFHIGPVHLSDGTVLSGRNVYLQGSIYNNNPISEVLLASWSRFLSSNINVATLYSGTYTRFGSLIGTYSQAFSSPDIITLVSKAKLGSASIARTINFPVQPPI